MIIRHTPGRLLLLISDCIILFGSLYLALTLRTWGVPETSLFLSFVTPFTLIIIVSVSIFYSYGLYDKPTLRIIRELSKRILTSQILVALSAVIIFYAFPASGIAPKTILILYVLISSALMSLWRHYAFSIVLRYKKQKSIIIGSGETFKKLVDELTRNPHTGITLISIIDVDTYDMSKVLNVLQSTKPNSVIIDMRDERIKPYFGHFYSEVFAGSAVLDIVDVYEDIFDMVPLPLINQEWVFRYVSVSYRYNGFKRFLDLVLALPAYIISLAIYPFIYIAIKIEDGGPIFFTHNRVGKHGKLIPIYKFRTMEDKPTNEKNETKKISKVGGFLRKTRLDEIPQLWNVIRGDVSLIGPRPEAPSLVEEYSKTIPFYNIRHTVRPGLSGWAQVQQHEAPKFGIDVKQTSTKLAYDLYYLEHSSLMLDIAIILKTFKVLLSKSGI
ncbi:exopolysaccharide biosynthesis polyprenyl glycosylphosphotransferase [Candidatus Gracilibacteria bacterium]|nr:exopolysaccharide biosynthesis polyprenyl glycosylphosphotransferase [Candidatus Gracilibacteria bacterium]